MVTWDGHQVLQLLLQVHDVIAQLNVIHPGETGHCMSAGYMGKHSTPQAPLQQREFVGGGGLCKGHTCSL